MKRSACLNKLRRHYSHGKENIIYFDESGFDKESYRTHGWVPRGQKVYGDVSGNNHKDVNLIMAQCRDLWLRAVVFKGGCCANLVNEWLEKFLLKQLKRPSVIVMDNAAFHKKSEIKMILEKAGHTLLLPPPYSPDRNPIKPKWTLG